MARQVKCEWAGAVRKKANRAFGQDQLAVMQYQKIYAEKIKFDGQMDRPTDRSTKIPTDRRKKLSGLLSHMHAT